MPQRNHCVGMKNYVEVKHCVEMNTQTNWLIDKNLSVDCRVLIIVEFDLKLLDCSKKLAMWVWVAKTTSNCKIPVLQVDWRLKLIQYSLNNQYCLRKLNEKSGKTGVYSSFQK